MKLQTSESASCPPCAFTDILPSSDSPFCCTGARCFPPALGRYRRSGRSRPPHLLRAPPAPRPEAEPRPRGLPRPPGAAWSPPPRRARPREIPLPFRSPRRSSSPSSRRRWGPEGRWRQRLWTDRAGPRARRGSLRALLPGRAGPRCRCAPAPPSPCSLSGEASRRLRALFGCGLSGSSAAASLRSAPLPFPPSTFPALLALPSRGCGTRSAPRPPPSPAAPPIRSLRPRPRTAGTRRAASSQSCPTTPVTVPSPARRGARTMPTTGACPPSRKFVVSHAWGRICPPHLGRRGGLSFEGAMRRKRPFHAVLSVLVC